MTTTRKQYSPKFKARVAVEAIRGERTLSHNAQRPFGDAASRSTVYQPLQRGCGNVEAVAARTIAAAAVHYRPGVIRS